MEQTKSSLSDGMFGAILGQVVTQAEPVRDLDVEPRQDRQVQDRQVQDRQIQDRQAPERQTAERQAAERQADKRDVSPEPRRIAEKPAHAPAPAGRSSRVTPRESASERNSAPSSADSEEVVQAQTPSLPANTPQMAENGLPINMSPEQEDVPEDSSAEAPQMAENATTDVLAAVIPVPPSPSEVAPEVNNSLILQEKNLKSVPPVSPQEASPAQADAEDTLTPVTSLLVPPPTPLADNISAQAQGETIPGTPNEKKAAAKTTEAATILLSQPTEAQARAVAEPARPVPPTFPKALQEAGESSAQTKESNDTKTELPQVKAVSPLQPLAVLMNRIDPRPLPAMTPSNPHHASNPLGAINAVMDGGKLSSALAARDNVVLELRRPSVAVPLESLAVEIAARARDGGKRFEIRLDPPELGRIEVRMDVGKDGVTATRLLVERSETLDLLQRDARSLEKALNNAGLTTDGGGLQFSLKDQSGSGRDFQRGTAQPLAARSLPEAEQPVADLAIVAYARHRMARGGLDIKV